MKHAFTCALMTLIALMSAGAPARAVTVRVSMDQARMVDADTGRPLVRLDEKGEALLRHVGATHVHVTLSHTETVAMAVAALVRA